MCASARVPAQKPANRSEAQILFEHGKAALDAGRIREACALLERSEKLEESIGTRGLLAACHERAGMLALAYREYLETADRARRAGDPREAYARERGLALERDVPLLTVVPRWAEPGLELTCDGRAILPATPERVDPGTHRIVASAPRKKAWTADVSLAVAERKLVEIPVLASEPLDSPPPKTETRAPPTSSAERAAAGGASPQRTFGWLGVGLGGAGIAAGAVLGILAINARKDLKADCSEDLCPPAQEEKVNHLDTLRYASTIAFAAGGITLAAGALLVITAPTPTAAGTPIAILVHPSRASLRVDF
jgi:hypothetical protein